MDGPKDIHDKTRIQKSGKGTFEIILENIKLSAGQKSKLQIVRCILRNKPIIMMDEPFANLDVTSKKQVADVLKEYANENVVLIATHDSIGGEIATQIIDINDMENQGELKD